jgi:hypothetical protein
MIYRYDKFSYDITGALAKAGRAGAHELIVRVFDPTEFAHIPLGKQRLHAPGTNTIFYTGSSGIWQTVWLEPVRAGCTPAPPGCHAPSAFVHYHSGILFSGTICHGSV